jgi:hypothetical protein
VVVDPGTEVVLQGIADRFVAGDAAAIAAGPLPPVEFLRWLTERRSVLFHGSARGDIEVLEPIRLSRDAREFGNQQAVFATTDPVWAIYFAILRRMKPFGTRNGSMAVAGSSIYPRWYTFSLLPPVDLDARFGPGFLYVLPREPFRPEPPQLGALDTAQWVSPTQVRPLVRVEVGPDDFPFLAAVGTYSEREPILVTILRAAVRKPTHLSDRPHAEPLDRAERLLAEHGRALGFARARVAADRRGFAIGFPVDPIVHVSWPALAALAFLAVVNRRLRS